MLADLTLPVFLDQNRISEKTWNDSKFDFADLVAIGLDHESRLEQLGDFAEYLARSLRRIPATHSVRLRVKDSINLLVKLVRKRAESNEKYSDISLGNYFTVVGDLIGLRILHLYKHQFAEIDEALQSYSWTRTEEPIAYIRDGDQEELQMEYSNAGFDVRPHKAGYRSVHYGFSSETAGRTTRFELQVRTIFEEGWSEIDHDVKYPNFSDDDSVAYVLQILNRLAGSADELGSFIGSLKSRLSEMTLQLAMANDLRDASFQKVDALLIELGEEQASTQTKNSTISDLRREIATIKSATSKNPNDASGGIGIPSLSTTYADLAKRTANLRSLVETFNQQTESAEILRRSLEIKPPSIF